MKIMNYLIIYVKGVIQDITGHTSLTPKLCTGSTFLLDDISIDSVFRKSQPFSLETLANLDPFDYNPVIPDE